MAVEDEDDVGVCQQRGVEKLLDGLLCLVDTFSAQVEGVRVGTDCILEGGLS